jgi:hypothetical protein
MTDIILFITNSDIKSSFFKKLNDVIGDNVPVLKLKDFEDFLAKKISSSLIDTFIQYLTDLGIITIINHEKIELIIPMFLLNENITNNKIVCFFLIFHFYSYLI